MILLTGAGSGIGKHLAGALAQRGHRVVATDVNEQGLSELSMAYALTTYRLDVSVAEDWERVFEAAERDVGPVDVLMNIAGVLKPGYVDAFSPRDVELHLDVNVKGTILGTAAAARRMKPRGEGHIINFGSLASLAPVPGLSLYAASKFAVRGFSLAVATELAPHNVFVTLVMPDAVQTPMLDLQAKYEEAALTFSGPKPLTTEDIERLILDKVLPDKPLEVAIPTFRAALARFACTVPQIAARLSPLLKKKGLASQARFKKERG